MMLNERTKFIRAIKRNLTPNLIQKKYRDPKNPLAGHCYHSSECAFYLFARKLGYSPAQINHEGISHWFLRNDKGKVIDITAAQFKTKVPYKEGRGRGFLTWRPSKRTQILMDRILK